MKIARAFFFTIALAIWAGLISGCASQTPRIALYDFGSPLHLIEPASLAPSMPRIHIAKIEAPSWLDSHSMHYRLNYDNVQQLRSYANSQWVMPPSNLFEQRLKARITHAGSVVLSHSENQLSTPSLRIEMLNFIQAFDNVERSQAQITVRVTIYDNQVPVAQKTFVRHQSSKMHDAAGGAQALIIASDTLIEDLLSWLTTQAKKP